MATIQTVTHEMNELRNMCKVLGIKVTDSNGSRPIIILP
jgi:hypothetical protein